jgi:adenylate kinase
MTTTKTIIVSGTPGTGKTTLAKKLAKHMKYKYIDVNKVIEQHDLTEGYDKERDSKIVPINKLKAKLKAIIKETPNTIIDSHLSHYLPKSIIKTCIITKCNLKELESRLKKRKYKKAKIRENLDAEIFDICLNEAQEKGHKIVIIDTSTKYSITNIINRLRIN